MCSMSNTNVHKYVCITKNKKLNYRRKIKVKNLN